MSKQFQIAIRISESEKELIEQHASEMGMKPASFVRSAALLAVKSSASRDDLLLAGIESKKEIKRKDDPAPVPVARPGNMLEQLSLDVDYLKSAVDELKKKI